MAGTVPGACNRCINFSPGPVEKILPNKTSPLLCISRGQEGNSQDRFLSLEELFCSALTCRHLDLPVYCNLCLLPPASRTDHIVCQPAFFLYHPGMVSGFRACTLEGFRYSFPSCLSPHTNNTLVGSLKEK